MYNALIKYITSVILFLAFLAMMYGLIYLMNGSVGKETFTSSIVYFLLFGYIYREVSK